MQHYRRDHERKYYHPRRQRSPWQGCFNALIFVVSLVLTLFVVYVVLTYRQTIKQAVPVVLIVVVVVIAIAVVGLVIWLVSAIWSFTSDRVTQIRMNQLEVRQKKAEIQHRYPQAMSEAPVTMQSYARTGYIDAEPGTRALLVRNLPTRENHAPAYQHKQIHPVYYHTVFPSIERGKILMGIRQDQSIRQGVWNDNKTVLILGNSSSGKTTTAIEKSVSAVLSGALLVTCDPHAHKEDSLTRRLYPLKDFLWPGTGFGVRHAEIYRNVQMVMSELNRRVAGGSSKAKLVLVVDEVNRLMRDETIARDLTKIIETIGQEGRGYNIYGIFICQQITGNALLRKSVNSYIVHRVDESEAKRVIPARYAKYAPELPTGLAIVKDADGMTEYLQQTIVTSQFIESIVETYGAQVQAFKARLQGVHALREPREPRVTRDLRKTVQRPTVKLVREPHEPEPRHEPRLEPLQNRAVWQSEYIEPEPAIQPQPVTTWAEPPEENAPGSETARLDQEEAASLVSPPPRQNIALPEEIKQQALTMARAGFSRRKIREATGLVGAKYELLKRLLDAEGL
ncbi:MAG TPA: hypothetical protein VFV38_24330 [Ktedonobacteraceae bacterium]|nr:hypothetical protein [Ktedonobacteraceae bacterium]